MQIYLARNNEQAGPYTLEQVNSMLASGQVVLSDLAWHDGLDNWQPLGQLTGGRLHYAPNTSTPFSSAPVAQPSTYQHTTPVNLNKHAATSEAEIASVGKRILGAVIDNVLTVLAAAPIIPHIDLAALEQSSGSMADMQALMANVPEQSLMLTAGILILILIIQAFLIITRGQSIGKILMKTRIVDQQTKVRPGPMNTFVIRTLVTNLAYNLPVVGMFILLADLGMMLFSDQRISLHDHLAKTLVLDARPEQLPNASANNPNS
ncbi:MAG: RDD family protein [Pseudomonadota bacterium]|nr:RDD family protein [Pseudomonadota bacterium]